MGTDKLQLDWNVKVDILNISGSVYFEVKTLIEAATEKSAERL